MTLTATLRCQRTWLREASTLSLAMLLDSDTQVGIVLTPLRSGDGAEQCADHEPVLPGASQAVSWGRCRQQTLNEATAAPALPGDLLGI